ncbi:prephenate dehydratase [Symmachiella dynata]|uniref:Bifunctional chorismate mutase/prephenate dehydratase n=1 Tax=Symmachiella dynata TaxID=2527995 RepID=A0A517ZV26_9PLAN|nr:prephenate dehydratase [Symmachiella dynata]QDT50639.1 Prephenate dehydratase [Symmachiella dynata]QDU46295.1 Prephenate dehydratase [Symmachiella dynata]
MAKAKRPAKKQTATKRPAAKRPAAKAASAKRKKPAAAPATRKAPAKRGGGTIDVQLKKLDREILKLINKRAELTAKSLNKLPNPQQATFNPAIDDEMWQQVQNAHKGPLPIQAVRSVFREIINGGKSLVKTQRIAYLGPAFSFTHLAAIERFGKTADFIPVNSIATVFEEVNRGLADFGIVPIENSTDGRVVDTLDMFTRLPLKICAEVQISIHHNLMSRCPRGEITEIYSKPQALSQCRDWLSRNMPQARLIEVTSTSTAAQLARDKQGVGAIASWQASTEYDLQIVAEDIQDNKNNVTRFAVIGDHVNKASGDDKTAILLQISHKPGSLADTLAIFKRNKVNLTWIESFPLKGPEGGYLFFLDFEGHAKEARVKRALSELERRAVRIEVLGSYPRSPSIE